MRLVAKFGGTSLGSGDRIEQAADAIANAVEAGHEVAVVVSAMGSTTDDLLSYITFDVDDTDRAEILGMGERMSARLVAAALTARGVNAKVVEPTADDWPIVLDSDNEVDLEATAATINHLEEALATTVPVITGFLGVTPEGEMRTLERGGSDTTAMVLGNTLAADRVVIVTDVEGVLTGNPDIIEATHNVGEISAGELSELSFRGAEVIAPEAITHKVPEVDVEIVHYQHADLLEEGTRVEGGVKTLVTASEEELACLTVAGRRIRRVQGVLSTVAGALESGGVTIDAISTGVDSFSLYVDARDGSKAERLVHDAIVDDDRLASVTLEDGLAAIRVILVPIHDRPGLIESIAGPLSDANINIHEMTTSATSVTAFVNWDVRDEALLTVKQGINDIDARPGEHANE